VLTDLYITYTAVILVLTDLYNICTYTTVILDYNLDRLSNIFVKFK